MDDEQIADRAIKADHGSAGRRPIIGRIAAYPSEAKGTTEEERGEAAPTKALNFEVSRSRDQIKA
jgi:hypothetical protein